MLGVDVDHHHPGSAAREPEISVGPFFPPLPQLILIRRGSMEPTPHPGMLSRMLAVRGPAGALAVDHLVDREDGPPAAGVLERGVDLSGHKGAPCARISPAVLL